MAQSCLFNGRFPASFNFLIFYIVNRHFQSYETVINYEGNGIMYYYELKTGTTSNFINWNLPSNMIKLEGKVFDMSSGLDGV